ncbi:DUF4097 family beta strand repeat-containing protein [Actinokineospora sp.]|uniref:DUF4097 family beta strand repeat-containing protein n=1 Tax=Actinokineospora sp. TaxID=1872133 RepID=UPI00403801CB
MSEPSAVVRNQSFDADHPIEISVLTGSGRIDVHLVDEPGVAVEVRHAPDSASPWMDGISNLVTWFSGQLGEQGAADPASEAVRQTRVEFADGRLVVRSPKAMQLRNVPIAVTVRAPHGSQVSARTGAAAVATTGTAGRVDVLTGSGEVTVEGAEGAVQVTTGTGQVRVGPAPAGLRVRTGGGDVSAAEVEGAASIVTGSGDVWLGVVSGDVMVRTGTGDVTIADAVFGKLDLTTGSGTVKVGVRAGSPAEIDLSSGCGDARSELPLSDERPVAPPSLRVRGRTGSGSALVTGTLT